MIKRILTAIFFTLGFFGVTTYTFEGVRYFVLAMQKTKAQVRKAQDAYYDLDAYHRALKRRRETISRILNGLFYFIYWLMLIYTYSRLKKEEKLIKKAKDNP
ncbi:MAG: hypothetical protein AAF380_00220 [Bacteroidota bacterium]